MPPRPSFPAPFDSSTRELLESDAFVRGAALARRGRPRLRCGHERADVSEAERDGGHRGFTSLRSWTSSRASLGDSNGWWISAEATLLERGVAEVPRPPHLSSAGTCWPEDKTRGPARRWRTPPRITAYHRTRPDTARRFRTLVGSLEVANRSQECGLRSCAVVEATISIGSLRQGFGCSDNWPRAIRPRRLAR